MLFLSMGMNSTIIYIHHLKKTLSARGDNRQVIYKYVWVWNGIE